MESCTIRCYEMHDGAFPRPFAAQGGKSTKERQALAPVPHRAWGDNQETLTSLSDLTFRLSASLALFTYNGTRSPLDLLADDKKGGDEGHG